MILFHSENSMIDALKVRLCKVSAAEKTFDHRVFGAQAGLEEFLTPSRDFALTQPSQRESGRSRKSGLGLSRTSSAASSDLPSGTREASATLSRSSSARSLTKSINFDIEEEQTGPAGDEEADEEQAPRPRKRLRVSESPEQQDAVERSTGREEPSRLDHRLPESSPPARSTQTQSPGQGDDADGAERGSSPDITILPSQPKDSSAAHKPPVRTETMSTMSASWAKIFGPTPAAPPKSNSGSRKSASSSASGLLFQKFSRTPSQPPAANPIEVDDDSSDIVGPQDDEADGQREQEEEDYMIDTSRSTHHEDGDRQDWSVDLDASDAAEDEEEGEASATRSEQQTLQSSIPLFADELPSSPSPPPESRTETSQPTASTSKLAAKPEVARMRIREPETSASDTPEVESTSNPQSLPSMKLACDMSRLRKLYAARASMLQSRSLQDEQRHAELEENAGVDMDEAEAQAALSRTVKQPDFAEMRICGQFNLGFIIARRMQKRSKHIEDDLFIIGKHAHLREMNCSLILPRQINTQAMRSTTLRRFKLRLKWLAKLSWCKCFHRHATNAPLIIPISMRAGRGRWDCQPWMSI